MNSRLQVVAGDYAFVALNKDAGTIQCWGFGLYGGSKTFEGRVQGSRV